MTSPVTMTGYVVAYLYLALGLSVLTDGPFMDTLDGLVQRYRLPSDVAGATLLAMASSAPELFTSVLDTFVFQNHIGIGTIIGSAIFNLLTIIAVSAWSTREALALNPSKVKRDIFWYTVTCVVLVLTTLWGSNTPWNMWALVSIQFYYVGYLTWQTRCGQRQETERNYNRVQSRRSLRVMAKVAQAAQHWKRKTMNSRSEVVVQVEGAEALEGSDTTEASSGGCGLCGLVCGFWKVLFRYTIPQAQGRERLRPLVGGFAMSVVWIVALTYGLATLSVEFTQALGMPDILAGLLILAPTTSLPDAIGSVAMVRQGQADAAVSNAIGSNIFDINIGHGLPHLILCLYAGSQQNSLGEAGWRSYLALALSLLLLVVTMVWQGWRLSRTTGTMLMLGYVGYVVSEVMLV